MSKRKKKILIGIGVLILLGTCFCCTVMGLLSADFNLNFEENRTLPEPDPGEQPSDTQQLQPQLKAPILETTEINGNTVTVYLTVYQPDRFNTIVGTPTLEGLRCQNMNAVRASLEVFGREETIIGLEFPMPDAPLPWMLVFGGREWEIVPPQTSENQSG